MFKSGSSDTKQTAGATLLTALRITLLSVLKLASHHLLLNLLKVLMALSLSIGSLQTKMILRLKVTYIMRGRHHDSLGFHLRFSHILTS